MKLTLTATLMAAGLAFTIPALAQTADAGAMKMDHDKMATDKMTKDKMAQDKMAKDKMTKDKMDGMAMTPMKKKAKTSSMATDGAMTPAPANAMTH